jgi:5-methylcytosine-specific restriction endonuclease McrA
MEIVEPYSTILVLNSSYEPLHFTNWKRAIILLFKEKAKLISKRVIRLVNFVRIPFTRLADQTPTRNMIYKRDGHSCQYCGSTRNLTIDHVIPRSKGGQDTWENLVSCCDKCNVSKGDKYLRETNMKLRSKPKAPISSVMLELERTKITEWKQFVFE